MKNTLPFSIFRLSLVFLLLVGIRSTGLGQPEPVFDPQKIPRISFGLLGISKHLADENFIDLIPLARQVKNTALEIGWGDAAINSNNLITRGYIQLLNLDSARIAMLEGFRIIATLPTSDIGKTGVNFTAGLYFLSIFSLDSALFYLNKIPGLLTNPTFENLDFIPKEHEGWKKLITSEGLNMEPQLYLMRGHTYNLLGLTYTNLTDHERADGYFQLAIDNYHKAQNPLEEGQAWINRGIAWQIPALYDKNFCEIAMGHFNQGLKALARSESVDSNFIGAVYRQLGLTNLLAGDTLQAYQEFLKAKPYLFHGDGKKLAQKVFAPAEVLRLSYLSELSSFEAKLEPREKALASVLEKEQQLDFLLRSGTFISEDILFSIVSNLCSAYTNLGEWGKSTAILRRGLEIYWPENNPFDNPDFDVKKIASSYHTSGVNLILNFARIYEAQYLETGSLEASQKMELFYRAAAEIIEEKRLALSQNPGKTIAMNNALLNSDFLANAAYNGLIRSIASKGVLSNEDQERIFNAMERSKAYLLTKAVENFERTNNIPEVLKVKESSFKNAMQKSRINLSLARMNSDIPKISQFEKEIKSWQDSMNYIYGEASRFDSSFFKFTFSKRLTTLKEIKSRVSDLNTALIEFQVQGKNLWSFFISSDTQIVHSVPLPSNFDTLMRQYYFFSQSRDSYNSFVHVQEYVNAAFELYKILIFPFINHLNGKSNILIIPSGALHKINFEYLLNSKIELPENDGKYFTKQLPDYEEFPFLIKYFSFQYGHSFDLIRSQSDLVYRAASEENYLNYGGFEPTYQNWGSNSTVVVDNKIIYDKPGHSYRDFEEVKKVKPIFPPISKEWLKEDADEISFREAVDKYIFGVLHFSCHGEINNARPELSRLLLTRNNSSSYDDVLTIGELANMEIRANLAIISSCNSGNSYFYGGGEGLMSIGRAFFLAGCPSLILGLWEVDSEATQKIVIRTCKYLVDEKKNTAEALRRAKLDYLYDRNISGGKKTPYYWGGLTLWGKNSKLFSD